MEALIVLFAQIGFLYLRTINVKYTSRDNMVGAVVSGTGVGMLWLITTGLGAKAVMNIGSEYLTIIAHLIGGAIGTVIGMKQKIK
jgi:hypothetical protein